MFIKITSSTKIGCVQNIINTTYITDSNNKLNPTSHAYQFIYTLDGCKYYDSNLISKNDFNTVKNDINILTDKVNNINSNLSSVYLSNNNDVFKLTVDSTGNLSTEKVKSYKIAIFGNSLEKHGLADYWWSTDRGMASSIINKDWCHQLSNMLY